MRVKNCSNKLMMIYNYKNNITKLYSYKYKNDIIKLYSYKYKIIYTIICI